jgi:hypothetical protein
MFACVYASFCAGVCTYMCVHYSLSYTRLQMLVSTPSPASAKRCSSTVMTIRRVTVCPTLARLVLYAHFMCCELRKVQCSQHSTPHTAHYTQHTAHYTPHTPHYTQALLFETTSMCRTWLTHTIRSAVYCLFSAVFFCALLFVVCCLLSIVEAEERTSFYFCNFN